MAAIYEPIECHSKRSHLGHARRAGHWRRAGAAVHALIEGCSCVAAAPGSRPIGQWRTELQARDKRGVSYAPVRSAAMKRVVIMALGAVAAGGIVGAPAIAGLTGNPSFSQQIPVPVPSQARSATSQANDHRVSSPEPSGSLRVVAPAGTPVGGAVPSVEPSDDHGGSRGPGGGGGSGR